MPQWRAGSPASQAAWTAKAFRADRMAELRKSWAWVERVTDAQKPWYWEPHHSGPYARARSGDRKAGAILFVRVDLRTVKEFTGRLKVDPATPPPGQPAPRTR